MLHAIEGARDRQFITDDATSFWYSVRDKRETACVAGYNSAPQEFPAGFRLRVAGVLHVGGLLAVDPVRVH